MTERDRMRAARPEFEDLFAAYTTASGTDTYAPVLPNRGHLAVHRDGAWHARYQDEGVDREAEGTGLGAFRLYVQDVRDAKGGR